jgi:hypothetical protein
MATFLFSAGLAALVLQAPANPADSTDAQAWLEIGRAQVQLVAGYHAHRTPGDTTWARAALDSADQAFARAARFGRGTRAADSAQVLRVYAWGLKALLEWETGGPEAALAVWQTLPDSLGLPPVLEELGENLLRACPRQGVLLTAGDADTYAAWYMRFARGLRPDLLILPLATWTRDSVFRGRVLRDARQRDPALSAFADRRGGPVCASMAFDRAPELRPRVHWSSRPLVWVAGVERKGDRVPAEDFVFAALRLAIDQHETWSPPVVAVYRRAVGVTPALCRPLGTFGLKAEAGCR